MKPVSTFSSLLVVVGVSVLCWISSLLWIYPQENIAVWSDLSPLFCPFHALTGWHCPGCGVTRSFLSLLAGDWMAFFRYNYFTSLLSVCALLVFGVGGGLKAFVVKKRQSIFPGLLVLALAWFLGRNIMGV